MYTHLKARKNPCFSLLSLDKKGGKWKERVERDIDLVEGKNMAYVFCDALQPKTEKLIAVFVSLSLSLLSLIIPTNTLFLLWPPTPQCCHLHQKPNHQLFFPISIWGPFFGGFHPLPFNVPHTYTEKKRKTWALLVLSPIMLFTPQLQPVSFSLSSSILLWPSLWKPYLSAINQDFCDSPEYPIYFSSSPFLIFFSRVWVFFFPLIVDQFRDFGWWACDLRKRVNRVSNGFS